MRRYIVIVLVLFSSLGLLAQDPPQELCVGCMGFACWQPPENPDGLLGYRLWLEGNVIGDVDTIEYQIDTDTLQNFMEYTFSVAAIYPEGLSEVVSFLFQYRPSYYYDPPRNFKGRFIDENKVKLTWTAYYRDNKEQSQEQSHSSWVGYVTHPGAGYNNGWDISALHDGLTAYGFNVNHDEGLWIMDQFHVPDGWTAGGIYGFGFFLFQDATPISTINGAYMAVYDGDPLNGGQLIAGSLDTLTPSSSYMAQVYRTSEDDFTEVNRPVTCINVGLNPGEIPAGPTYWFIVSFTGSLKGGVYAVPCTALGQTTTGEARIYDPENGWQPLLDPGTGTQQGIAFYTGGPGNGGVYPAEYSDLYRDGELIAHGIGQGYSDHEYIDENVTPGVHSYSLVNVYYDGWEQLCLNKSEYVTIDVRRCYPPKNFEVESASLDDNLTVSHLTWDEEDDIPQREDIKTFYEIYRKRFGDNHFNLIGVLHKDEGLDSFEYYDTVPEGIYYYRINDYNVYPSGSVQSSYAGQYGDCDIPYWVDTDIPVSAEFQWNNGSEGAMVHWGELVEGELRYDNGEFIDVYDDSNEEHQWGICINYGGPHRFSLLKSVSLYTVADGNYDILVYEGYNQPETLLAQKTVQLSGTNQWHTVSIDSICVFGYSPLWITIRTQNIDQPMAYGGNNGSSDNGRWIYNPGNHRWDKTYIDGSFMIRANYSTRFNVEDWPLVPEPSFGVLHYNLYRSTDHHDNELVATIPFILDFNYYVEYFDPHDDPTQECYYYQLTLTYRDYEDGSYCETTPMPNSDNPLVDWAEVCTTWESEETADDQAMLYPNPTTGLQTITMEHFHHAEVYDLTGRLMKHSNSNTLDFSNLTKGIYILKIVDNSGNIINKKIIKQ